MASAREAGIEGVFAAPRAGDPDRLVPTDYARGPWHPETQHGSPALGLLARAIERHPGGAGRLVTRLTVDLMRAAPMAPVRTRSRRLRAGRRIEIIEASLVVAAGPADDAEPGHDATLGEDAGQGRGAEGARTGEQGVDAAGDEDARETVRAGERIVARATAMRVAPEAAAVPAELGSDPPPAMALADDNPPIGFSEGGRTVFHHALEMSPVPGAVVSAREGALWLRLRVPLVEGEVASPLVRAAVASDYAYSVPALLQLARDPRRYARQPFVAINTDATLSLHRPPEGEWLCVDARNTLDPGGLGTAIALLSDRRGAVGHVSQSFLVRPAERRPESWRRYRSG